MLIAAAIRVYRAFVQGYLQRSEKMAHQALQEAFARCGRLPDTAGILLTLLGEICYARTDTLTVLRE
jgi:hypothetical protein